MNEPAHSDIPVSGPPEAAAAHPGLPLPLHKPRATFVLLGVIAVVFVLQLITDLLAVQVPVFAGDAPLNILVAYGSEINGLVSLGGYWRLLTAMFLHFSIAHVVFNGWALLSLGQEVESLYGARRFLLIYFLSGLFSGMVSYLLAPLNWLLVPSAGASGAIFGIVGADVAFFLTNRRSMGNLGQRQLINLAILIAINLAIGFSPGSGINNYAHLGGLVGGLLLGLGLAPRFGLAWDGFQPYVANRRSGRLELIVTAGIVLLFLAGIYLGDQRWAPFRAQLEPLLLLAR
ncbi:MAG TPA: rhomboid family intramembrane serine protease [Anaerolineae bacterium]